MTERTLKGSCLCGDVSYELVENIRVFQYCHCSRCRKFTGTAHASNIIIDPENFRWLTGEENLGRFEHPEAKHFATSFCNRCGSSLPWMTKSRKAVIVPAGTLDDVPSIKPMHNIYYADKAEWYEDVCLLTKYDALPVK